MNPNEAYDLRKPVTFEALCRAGLFGLAGQLFFLAKDWLGDTSDVSPEKQAEAVERVIRAGRDNGVKKLRLKVNKEVGAKFTASEPQSGVKIGGRIGSDGGFDLEIEYE